MPQPHARARGNTCAKSERLHTMASMAQTNRVAPYTAAFVGKTRGTLNHLRLLDHLHSQATRMRAMSPPAVALVSMCQYGAALLPLAVAVGDLSNPTAPVKSSFAARPVIHVGTVPDFRGLPADEGLQPAEWSLADYAGSRVIDQAYLILCAAAQRALATALTHWAVIDEAFGHAFSERDGANDEQRSIATARLLIAAGAKCAPSRSETGGGDDGDDDPVPPASRQSATTTDIETLCGQLHGLSATLRALVQNDVDGAGATGALQQLRTLALALASVCADVATGVGAAWVLHSDVAVELRFRTLRHQPPACWHPDAVSSIRALRACWLRSASALVELEGAVVGNDSAHAALRALFVVAVRWTDSCRRLHFRAASLFFATHCDLAAAVWCRVCALQDAPLFKARATGLQVDLPGVFAEPPPDVSPVIIAGAHLATARINTEEAPTVALPVEMSAPDSALSPSLMAATLETILPPAPRFVPWCPNGVPEGRMAKKDDILSGLLAWRDQLRTVGSSLMMEFVKPTEYVNWDLPTAYAALFRAEMDNFPLSTRVLERADTDAIMEAAAAAAADMALASPTDASVRTNAPL